MHGSRFALLYDGSTAADHGKGLVKILHLRVLVPYAAMTGHDGTAADPRQSVVCCYRSLGRVLPHQVVTKERLRIK